jgi:hypothetical protein
MPPVTVGQASRGAAEWADLRRPPSDAVLDEVIGRVEAGLRVAVDRAGLLRKRRSIGARSTRGTWVRIEARPVAKLVEQGQPCDGLEAAHLLDGVAAPGQLRRGLAAEALFRERPGQLGGLSPAALRQSDE